MANKRHLDLAHVDAALEGSATAPGLESLSSWAAEIRQQSVAEIPDAVSEVHIAAVAQAAAVANPGGAGYAALKPTRVERVRRRLVFGSLLSGIGAKVFATSVALATATGGVAATGSLPDSIQDPVAGVYNSVGFDFPTSHDDDECTPDDESICHDDADTDDADTDGHEAPGSPADDDQGDNDPGDGSISDDEDEDDADVDDADEDDADVDDADEDDADVDDADEDDADVDDADEDDADEDDADEDDADVDDADEDDADEDAEDDEDDEDDSDDKPGKGKGRGNGDDGGGDDDQDDDDRDDDDQGGGDEG